MKIYKLRKVAALLILSLLFGYLPVEGYQVREVQAADETSGGVDEGTLLEYGMSVIEGSSGYFKADLYASGEITRWTFESSDTGVLTVDEGTGFYQALHYGTTIVKVTGYGTRPVTGGWWDDDDNDDDWNNWFPWAFGQQPEDRQIRDIQSGNWPSGDASSDGAQQGNLSSGDASSGDAQQGNLPSGDASSGDTQQGNLPSGDAQQGNLPSGDVQPGTGEESFSVSETYEVRVLPDASQVTLSRSSLTLYAVDGYYYSATNAEVKLNGSYLFDQEDVLTEFDYSATNDDMYVSCELKDNVLYIQVNGTGKTTLEVVINKTVFSLQIKVKKIRFSKTSLLLSLGQETQLKVKGTSQKSVWKSSNSKVATVTQSGKIKAKGAGNTIISAKVGDAKIGCVVSVTTEKKKRAVRTALKIASTGVYSQPKRMQKGYYDCSSLVWRSYSPQGYYFGARNYAPVAASLAQYLVQNNKMVKGGLSEKNLQKLKLHVGDLFFETGSDNGRYKGIYHVEMFVGYEFGGYDSAGKPFVYSKWAARPDGYYGYSDGLVGRP